MVIQRHKTAIARKNLSVPVRVAIRHGVLMSCMDVLDYGCGRGTDVKLLTEDGFYGRVTGYDPHYFPTLPLACADVVFLSYVLNVIEDPQERDETLRQAWAMVKPKGSLVVTVRAGKPLSNCTPYGDGQVTRTGTFQKLYQLEEFVFYVLGVLGVCMRVVKVSGGLIAIITRP